MKYYLENKKYKDNRFQMSNMSPLLIKSKISENYFYSIVFYKQLKSVSGRTDPNIKAGLINRYEKKKKNNQQRT